LKLNKAYTSSTPLLESNVSRANSVEGKMHKDPSVLTISSSNYWNAHEIINMKVKESYSPTLKSNIDKININENPYKM